MPVPLSPSKRIDARAAAALFREHARRHEARFALYREFEAQMVRDAGGAQPPVTTQAFATYAALRRGIGRVREYAAWCHWVADQLEAAATEGGDAG